MRILVVEDNKGDQLIMREALEEAKVNWNLNVVEDGVQAMEYLTRRGIYTDSIRPDVVILDLNLPRKNGREVLAEIRNHPQLKHLLVLILSNSAAEDDVCACYGLSANLYMRKPSSFLGFVNIAEMLKTWKDLAQRCSHG